jgi:hypothetical protein
MTQTESELTGKRTQRTDFKSPYLFSKAFYENLCLMHVKLLHGTGSSKVTTEIRIVNKRS